MTVPGGVPNLPVGALTLGTMATKLQDMSGQAMKDRAVERFPSIMDSSTGLSAASDITPFGILTSIFSQVNSLVANADPADIQGPEDLPALVVEFIEGLPVIGQFVEVLEAILGTYAGEDGTLLAIQNIFAPVRALMTLIAGIPAGLPSVDQITTGVNQLLQAIAGLASLAGAVGTALTSANQATDIARQMMALVMQIVQGLDNAPVIGDFVDAVQGFAFWILGWFGVTQQSVTNSNPAVAAALGRIGALESTGTVGLEGFADHFNRPLLGTDWADITPYAPLEIIDGAYVKSTTRKTSRYALKTLVTDTWHVQAVVGLDHGSAIMYASCAPGAADAGTGNGVALELQHETFFVGPFPTGLRDTFRLYSMAGGLTTGTLRRQVVIDGGNVKTGDVLAIEYWEDTNTFFVFLNNNELTGMQWEDTSNVVDHGVGNREVILMTGSQDNVFAPGPYFDDLSAYDIKVA